MIMTYTYKKLSDVTLVDNAVEPNLLIEDEGEVKKIPASNIAVPQVKADWEETDETSAAFIMNKPDLSQAGGGANVITYTIDSGALMKDGIRVTGQEFIDEWNNGSIIRIKTNLLGTEGGSHYEYSIAPVDYVKYSMNSGSLMVCYGYYDSNSQRIVINYV